MILTMFFLNEEDKCVENLYVVINKRKDGCTFMLEAATRSYILYFFGKCYFYLGVLKSDVCSNHVLIQNNVVFVYCRASG